jgi:hypothetical protein
MQRSGTKVISSRKNGAIITKRDIPTAGYRATDNYDAINFIRSRRIVMRTSAMFIKFYKMEVQCLVRRYTFLGVEALTKLTDPSHPLVLT